MRAVLLPRGIEFHDRDPHGFVQRSVFAQGKRDPSDFPGLCDVPVRRIPDQPGWVFELKLDGFRGQAVHDENGIRLYSRNGKDFTRKFPRVTAALKTALQPGTALDGELVAFDEMGRPSFAAIQDANSETNVVFFVFDILQSHGKDTKQLPLTERLALLQSAFMPSDIVQHCEHFIGPVEKFLAGVRKIGGEGDRRKTTELDL